MTHGEWAIYHNDLVKARKLHKDNREVSLEIIYINREIHRRKWNAEMHNVPYISVFEEELL